MKITHYKLSGDKQGLLAFFFDKNGDNSFYHIHSDEMTAKQRQEYNALYFNWINNHV